MKELIKLIVQLENIRDSIQKFNEFEHSLDYVNPITYNKFMELIDNTLAEWESLVNKELNHGK